MTDAHVRPTSTLVSSTLIPQGLLTLAVKTHLSVNHILGAAVFARQCRGIEAAHRVPPPEDVEIEHRSFAIGAPIQAVAFLEAAINELYVAAGHNDCHVFGSADPLLPKLMVQFWDELEEKRILMKYQTTLLLAQKPTFNPGGPPFQAAGHLIALRNALVHYKPEWDSQLKAHKDIENRLGKAFAINPFAANDKAFFPARCLGYGCAAWSVRTAWEFVKAFYLHLGLPYWALDYETRIANI